MLRKVKLYGELADKYGKEWDLNINSPTEAVKALCANNPGFREFMSTSEERGMGYKVIVGDTYVEELKELGHPSGRQSIKIVPVVLGAKSKGLGMIIMGVLMVVGIGFVIGTAIQAAGVAGATAAGATVASAQLAAMTTSQIIGMGISQAGGLAMAGIKIGVGLIASGIASMLAPDAPEEKSTTSYNFGGPVNTTMQGVVVPVCYGQLMVGGAVISASIQAEEHIPVVVEESEYIYDNDLPFNIV